MTETNKWIGRTPEELHEARKKLGADCTRRHLAKLLGIDENTLWRREVGRTTRLPRDIMESWDRKLRRLERRHG